MIKWEKNIDSVYGWETSYDNAGGYISESGNWKIFREGKYVYLGKVVKESELTEEDWEEVYFDGKRGDWQVFNNDEFYAQFKSLKKAKAYVESFNFHQPNEKQFFAKGGKIKEALKEIEKLKETHYCSVEFGDCVAASNDASDILDKYNIDYVVKEGGVYTNRLIPKDYYGKGTKEHQETKQHTWIELKNGQKIDLSIEQFADSGGIKEYKNKYLGEFGKQWTAEEYRKQKEKERKKTKAKPYLSDTNWGYSTKLPKGSVKSFAKGGSVDSVLAFIGL